MLVLTIICHRVLFVGLRLPEAQKRLKAGKCGRKGSKNEMAYNTRRQIYCTSSVVRSRPSK